MSKQDRTTLKSYFQAGDRPTEAQLVDLVDSFVSSVDDNILQYVDVRRFGATGDGTTDDTTAIENADASTGSDQVLFLANGRYNITGLSITSSIHMERGAEFVYTGAQNGTAIDISAAVDCGDIYVDGNLNDVTGVLFSSAGATARKVVVRNVNASATSSTSIYGVSINANNVRIHEVELYDNENTGQANVSFPQGCAVVGTSDNIHIGNIYQENGAAGFVSGGSSGEIKVGNIDLQNTEDNGCYLLGGDVTIDNIYYSGDNEPVVAIANKINISNITTYGSCFSVVGVQNVGELNVDEIVITPDSTGATASGIVSTRSSNTSAGKVTIGSVKGTIQCDTILTLDDGTIEYFNIRNIDLKQIYEDHGNGFTRWFDLRSCEGFSLKDIHIRIIDPLNTLINTDRFQSQTGGSPPTKQSFVHNFDVETLQSDETSVAPFAFRGSWARTNLEVRGARWRELDPGIFARETSFGAPNTVHTEPVSGSWNAGTVLYQNDADPANFVGWICISSGSPGDWRAFGEQEHRSAAASPVGATTPGRIGEEFLDTSTATWYKSTGLTDADWVALN